MKTTVALAGLGGSSRVQAVSNPERLALDGGPQAVTFPEDRHSALTKWPRYGPEEKNALAAVIEKGDFYQQLPLLEEEWKAYTRTAFCKAHMNGSSALTSMYFALDLPPGSEIMVPSYTFFAQILPMRFFSCTPIFIDIDPRTATFDLDYATRHLTKRTRALCPMHSWGMPCEMDRISSFAQEKGLILLEDAAHAHGASMQGKMMGTWGDMGICSFQKSKVLPAIEGGMGMYQKREYYERAAAFGHYEDPAKFPEDSPVRAYEGTGFGQKYRMHPLAAVLLREQLRTLDQRNALVERQVRQLNGRLAQLPGLSEPVCRPDQKRVYYYANMLFFDEKKAGFSRQALLKALRTEGVKASIWGEDGYPLQHKYKIYSEAKWWHHKPKIPDVLPGSEQVNRSHFFVALLYEEAPELIEQYARAFEKVWAKRGQLAKIS
ncbi:MAG: DegT/DnrJ/EryC1/StrS family aminotransferase [bacterium]